MVTPHRGRPEPGVGDLASIGEAVGLGTAARGCRGPEI